MSKKPKNCPNPYTVHEINKKILKKEEKKRLDHECLGYKNKYRDENSNIYEIKKRQFLEAGKKYHEMNKLALLNNKVKLEDAYNTLNFDFLEEIAKEDLFRDDKYKLTGRLLNKRTERPINKVPEINYGTICMTEPWFRRYLILNKFIQVARGIIYKRRLLKNLQKLRLLDEEKVLQYEAVKKQCDNVSYKEIFDQYL